MVSSTSDVRLRDVAPEDHAWLVELHNDPLVLRNLTDPTPITLDSHMAWWKGVSGSTREIRKVFECGGQRAGFTKFYSIDRANKNCILGADLHASYRGRGLAKPMWRLMLDECFYTLGMHRVSLTTAAYNDIAIHVYESLGFKREGAMRESLLRDGTYHDQIAMYMLDSDWEALA